MAEAETRENEIEFISYGEETKVVGRVWWDGQKVDSDSAMLLARLKDLQLVRPGPDRKIIVLTIGDGVEFLDGLPDRFRSYLSARKLRTLCGR